MAQNGFQPMGAASLLMHQILHPHPIHGQQGGLRTGKKRRGYQQNRQQAQLEPDSLFHQSLQHIENRKNNGRNCILPEGGLQLPWHGDLKTVARL